MNIGEKIKKLRTDKFMTQSELAGSEITRNMLSRIENGAAQPSLDTLRYIASRLSVSPGFLLSGGEDERMYIKHNDIKSIKTAYLSGDYRICRDICLKSSSIDDDEVQLILAECTLSIAVEEFCAGALRSSCEYFDLAIEACAGTIYDTGHIAAIAAMYFKYMRRISATLSSECIDEMSAPIYASLNDRFCVYACEFLDESENVRSIVENKSDMSSAYGLHIDAIKHMKTGDYRYAYDCLHSILISDGRIPDPMLYFVFCDLEICCKEIEDFKGAYEYSIDKMELLQRLLS